MVLKLIIYSRYKISKQFFLGIENILIDFNSLNDTYFYTALITFTDTREIENIVMHLLENGFKWNRNFEHSFGYFSDSFSRMIEEYQNNSEYILK
jgi:hypothetical protein